MPKQVRHDTKMKIIFFGSSNYIIPVIEDLRKNFDLSLVVTTEKNPSDPIPSYCLKNKIKCVSASNNKELSSKLSLLSTELGILASFGLIIPSKVLKLFKKGMLNIHPSLLPKFRGPTPVQNAILSGDKKTGVSIIKLDNKVDHGPILAQTEEEIKNEDTSETLYKRLFAIGSELLIKIIPVYAENKIKPIEQDEKQATFTKSLNKKDGFIDLTNSPPKDILKRMIRAYYPWPGVWSKVNIRGKEKIIKLLPASPFGGTDEKIQTEGKKPMSFKNFINGYPEASTLLKNF